MSELPHAPRKVRPRVRRYAHRQVIVISNGMWVDESGATGPLASLDLPALTPTIFAAQGVADVAATLDDIYSKSHPGTWQYRISTQERAIIRPLDGVKVAARVSTVVHYISFKNGNGHKCIDPVTMYGHGLEIIWPGDEPAHVRLMHWAQAVRDFCDENMMEVRPTIGSIAGQFWTDRRFYPNPRRKVPETINARTRENLPGNHYALTVEPSPRHYFTAWYLDQSRAHHYHAQTTALPNANSVHAYGYFKTLDAVCFTELPPGFHGLYCLDLEVPSSPWLKHLKKQGPHFVFSNEVQFLLDMGCRILGVRAAWGSDERDEGVARYATFATRELDRHGDPAWLKPLLLAAYGTLATRASWGETIFRLARKGEEVSVRTGQHELSGTLVRAPQKLEPKIVNVIHRGMIEAATRTESLGLAHYLGNNGHRILSIYADAVIVEADDDRNLPMLPDPWRLKRTLNHLQFVSQQAFMSGEMTKLPGIGRETKEYARRATGYAPRKKTYDALSGQPILTDRRI